MKATGKIAMIALFFNVILSMPTTAMAQDYNFEELERAIKELQEEVEILRSASDDTKKIESNVNTQFKGKVSARVFADYSHGLFSNNDDYGFNLERAILGYSGTFGSGFSANLEVDFASTRTVDGVKEYATYVRNAELSWRKDNFKVNFGMITPKAFNYVENQWGYRYVAKIGMDEYKFAPSRDLGVVLTYDLVDWLSVDATVTNGEGYKVVSVNNSLKYSFGATVSTKNGLRARVYGEIYEKGDEIIGGKSQNIISAYLGYESDAFVVGACYDQMWNGNFITNQEQSIVSAFGHYNIDDKYSIFARYDKFHSTDDWNGGEDALYLGFEYHPVKYVKIAPALSYKESVKGDKEPMIGLFLDLKY